MFDICDTVLFKAEQSIASFNFVGLVQFLLTSKRFHYILSPSMHFRSTKLHLFLIVF